jgi:formylglycine-generating enzyme required for sulfatase activity
VFCVAVAFAPAASAYPADELDAIFDEMVASAKTDEERIENARLLMEKAAEFPERRKGIEKRALDLAREAEQPESLEVIEEVYTYWLEQPGTPDERIYAVLIGDFTKALSWEMPEEAKMEAAEDVLTFYDASVKYLVGQDRYTEATAVLEEKKDFVKRYRRAVDPDRRIYATLKDRIDEMEELAEKKAERGKLLAEAKANPENQEVNAKAGIALFNEDKLAQALPFLKRGGEAAQPYLSIARKLEPLYNPRTPGGTTQAMLDRYESVLGEREEMLPLAKEMMNDPDLQRPAAEVVVYIDQDEPLDGRGETLLEAGQALLLEKAVAPEPLALYEAAQALAALAKRDDDFGEKGMAEESRYYLWKAVELYKRFLAAAPEGAHKTETISAEMQGQILAKKLEDASGYSPAGWRPRAEVALADVGRVVKQAKRTLGQAVVYGKWPFDAEEARRRQVETAKRLGLPVELVVRLPESEATVTLVLIPAGAFAMGTPEETVKQLMEKVGDKWFLKNAPGEYPRHGVRITRPFYLGRTEVTQAQWEAVTGNNPSSNQGGGALPVEEVSWGEVTGDFLAKANAVAKLEGEAVFALPTEAQWEYACRAGTATEYHAGDGEEALDTCGWYGGNSGGKSHPVGGKEANAWTLHDMHGNVWEWCRDNYDRDWYRKEPPTDNPVNPGEGNSHRVIRGGARNSHPSRCRSAHRHPFAPDRRFYIVGWRLSLDLH